MTDDADVRIARMAVQVGNLEERIAELRADLDGERSAHARARRQVGQLLGIVRGAVNDGAVAADYLVLAERVIAQISAEIADAAPRPGGVRSDPSESLGVAPGTA